MAKLDGTLDDVQNTRFHNIYHDLIKTMPKQTQFTEMEVESILMVYHKFVLANGPKAKCMTVKQFHNLFLVIFKVYDLQIMERILQLITATADVKKEVGQVAWVKVFNLFMSHDLVQKMKFTFHIYNVAFYTSFLNREIVTLAFEKFFTGEDEVNELRADIVELLFKKFDVDKDGVISYDDYATVVTKQPMVLEFFRQCFPTVDDMTDIAYCSNILSLIVFQKRAQKEDFIDCFVYKINK